MNNNTNPLRSLIGRTLILGAFTCLFLPTVSAGSEEAPSILAIVNEDTITTADLDQELVIVHSRQSAVERADFKYRKLLDKLVNDRLIVQEATALGMGEEPWLIKLLDDYSRDNAIRYFVADKFNPDLSVDSQVIRDMFNRNYRKFQIRTVAVADSLQAVAYDQAVAHGADMDSLAREVSLDVHSIRGGLHNFNHQADIEPALLQHALTLDVGELSDVFPYRDVYAFLRVEKTAPADTAELEKYWPGLEKTITRQKQSRAWDEFVAIIAGKYSMTIDTAVIDRVLADSSLLFTQNFVNDDTTPALTMDGDLVLTESDLRTSTSRIAMNMGNQTIRPIVTEALNDGEERLALLAAAREAGYLEDERVANRYQHSLDSALIEAYLKETVVSQISFNWAEFEEYYNEHLDDFRRETQYQFDRIEVADSAKANEVAQRLADGADFNFIANLYDPNPERKAQANEWVTLASMPGSVSDELEAMAIGGVAKPIKMSEGYMFLRLRNKKLGTPQPLQDVEMRIREIKFQQKFNDLLDKTLETLKANSHIEYRQKAIDKYFGSES